MGRLPSTVSSTVRKLLAADGAVLSTEFMCEYIKTFSLKKNYIYLFIQGHTMPMEARGLLAGEIVFSFHRVDPGDGTQVLKLVSKHLYLTSSLTTPRLPF